MKAGVKIGFIGYGNMAQAIAKGLTGTGVCDGDDIYACAAHFDTLRVNAEKLGIHAAESAREVAEHSDFVVLAVKPDVVERAVAPILDVLREKAIVSIAAGYDFDSYERILLPGTRHISTIPNTPIAVGEGILVCERKHSLTKDEFERFSRVFGSVALIELVETERLAAAGTLCGCTPAFTAMYMEALADAGVKHGIARDAAYRMAARVLAGTGKLYLENGDHPGIMKDAVCSPGGTTIRGVAALEKGGFRGIVIEAIDAIEGH